MNILNKEQISNLPEWMAIEGFPNYEVNCREGLVRNVKRLRVLKPRPDGDGYPKFEIRKDGKLNTKKIHRLVAESAFGYYGIPTDGLLVLHLDETRTNSCIDNLALGTQRENMAFPKFKQKNSDSHTKKPVGAYKDGRLILKFSSISEAGKDGFDKGNISNCCRGRSKTHRGLEWRYLTA